jgi:hypothetical protein
MSDHAWCKGKSCCENDLNQVSKWMNYDKTNLLTSDDDTIAAYFILWKSYILTQLINVIYMITVI